MKSLTGQEVLNHVIQNWWLIREKFFNLEFRESFPPEAKGELLKAKAEVARKLQPLINKQGNPQDIRGFMLRFMRRIPSLRILSALPPQDLKAMEKECHHIYIWLNKWYGEINIT